MTPQSSSNFNIEITNLLRQYYLTHENKNILTVPNSFQKTPENITIDPDALEQNIKMDVAKYVPSSASEEFQDEIQRRINEIYDNINLWKIESDIEPVIVKLRRGEMWIKEFLSKKKLTRKELQSVRTIQSSIQRLHNELHEKYGDIYRKTKHFRDRRYQNLKSPEEIRPWQIKKIADASRKALSHIFSLTKEFDIPYEYNDITGNKVTGVSKFIDRLKRNNKTILIFDDNMSSGATLDDICNTLIESGVNKDNIIVITLGIVPPSIYNLNDIRKRSMNYK